ncbi:DUF3719 domain-containing protein [Candidatus Peregrinibacteria bacterium]|nr:DUF3719 domain-containing protein [Candidatus Peregrinibacteria bacterium]
MKSYSDYIWFETEKKVEYIRITDEVEQRLFDSGIQEGFCLVSAMHITASVYVNDAEQGLIQDINEWLQHLAPEEKDYRHNSLSDPNAEAHLRRLIMGHQVVLPVTEGKLDLGPWEQVYYAEFDGQRRKRVVIKIIGE